MKTKDTQKPISEMTTAELDEMAAEFDREFVIDTFGPMTPASRARWKRVQNKRGRPRTGAGCKAISVTVEKTLLKRVDALARRRKVSRARLVSAGLRAVLAAEQRAAVG